MQECINTRFIPSQNGKQATIEAIYNHSLMFSFNFNDNLNIAEKHIQAARKVVTKLHLGEYDKDWIHGLLGDKESYAHFKKP